MQHEDSSDSESASDGNVSVVAGVSIEDSADGCIVSGYLSKIGKTTLTRQTRYFVLKDSFNKDPSPSKHITLLPGFPSATPSAIDAVCPIPPTVKKSRCSWLCLTRSSKTSREVFPVVAIIKSSLQKYSSFVFIPLESSANSVLDADTIIKNPNYNILIRYLLTQLLTYLLQ